MLSKEDESLKGNLGAIRKEGVAGQIPGRNSATAITPKKGSALKSKEREELKWSVRTLSSIISLGYQIFPHKGEPKLTVTSTATSLDTFLKSLSDKA